MISQRLLGGGPRYYNGAVIVVLRRGSRPFEQWGPRKACELAGHGLRYRIVLMSSRPAFNLTNQVNYHSTSINRNLNSPAFLERRTARDARQIPWGIRYSL